jgi:multidrug resistance protein, MATE family
MSSATMMLEEPAAEPRATNLELLWELLRIAAPLMLGNLFYSLQIAVDRVFLTRFDPDAPAASLAAAMIAWVPICFLQTTAGFAVTFVAQYVGAGRTREVGPSVAQAMWFAVAGGLALIAMIPFAGTIIDWVGHDARLRPWETQYMWFLLASGLPIGVQAAATSFYSGRGQTSVVLGVNAFATAIHITINPIFIFGAFGLPGWGVPGAGAAYFLTSCASATLAVWLATRSKFETEFAMRSGWAFNKERFIRHLKFGAPNGLQTASDVIGWALFVLFVGWLGSAPLAATSIVFAINALFYIPMIGMAQASGVLVGQRLGDNDPETAERGVWTAAFLAIPFMGLMGLLVAAFPQLSMAAFANFDKPDEWSQVSKLLPTLLWFVAIYSVFDGLVVLFSFSLRGAGDTFFVSTTFFTMSLLFLILPTWWICRNGYGLSAAWTVATLYLVLLSAAVGLRFWLGPWRSMRVIEPLAIE